MSMDDLVADIDLQALRVVRAIGDTGSITAAAESLGYSQPAVSQQIRRLEGRIGMAVVERVGRSVRLTQAGRVLAQHAGDIARTLEAAAGELAELRGSHTGHVRLAGFPSASPTIVPLLLADVTGQHPGITVTYVEAEPPEAVAAVREGRADVALTFSYPGDRDDPHGDSAHGLAVHAIGYDELFLVVPEDDGMATATTAADVRAFADADWIAGCPRCRGHLLELCGRAGFVPRIAFETDNIVAVESLVARGTGVATLPRLAVESFPVIPGVRTLPLPHAERRTLHVVTARGADRVPPIRVVLAALGRATRQAGAGTPVARGASGPAHPERT